jgi:hypothetical protein
LERILEGDVLKAICIPAGQSWACPYFIQLALGSGLIVEITSSSTCVEGWDEFGTVNVTLANSALVAGTVPVDLSIKHVGVLLFANESVVVESGLTLESENGAEIVIAAGQLPGSMSLKAAFQECKFEPQFPESAYDRTPLSADMGTIQPK